MLVLPVCPGCRRKIPIAVATAASDRNAIQT
jgi:hypothetical protein